MENVITYFVKTKIQNLLGDTRKLFPLSPPPPLLPYICTYVMARVPPPVGADSVMNLRLVISLYVNTVVNVQNKWVRMFGPCGCGLTVNSF